jgi:hypothetical protein
MTKKPIILAAALVVAAGLVAFKVLIYPPVTLAAPSPQGLDIHQVALSTSKDLPSFDAKYQRHLGVLDVLNK